MYNQNGVKPRHQYETSYETRFSFLLVQLNSFVRKEIERTTIERTVLCSHHRLPSTWEHFSLPLRHHSSPCFFLYRLFSLRFSSIMRPRHCSERVLTFKSRAAAGERVSEFYRALRIKVKGFFQKARQRNNLKLVNGYEELDLRALSIFP